MDIKIEQFIQSQQYNIEDLDQQDNQLQVKKKASQHTFRQKKSSFSKSINRKRSQNSSIKNEEQILEESTFNENKNIKYISMLKEEFDYLRNYEDIIIKIINNFSKIQEIKPKNQFSIDQYLSEKVMKKTIFLDIEGTILSLKYNMKSTQQQQNELILQNSENKNISVHAILRPGLEKFLQSISKEYEIILINNNTIENNYQLLDCINNQMNEFNLKQHTKLIIDRDSYSQDEQGHIFLNLRILLDKSERKLSDSLIIDKNPYTFLKTIENGIPIPLFNGDQNDEYLPALQSYLMNQIKEEVTDVRKKIRQNFEIEKIESESTANIMKKLVIQKNATCDSISKKDQLFL